MRLLKFKILLILICFLYSCSGFKEAGKALRNEKDRSADQFLIEKRGPLTLPPDMNELPKPRSKTQARKKNDIKKVLGNDPNEAVSRDPTKKSEIEELILQEIR